jgi:glycosyltransferase involved in cell wall biosynthesis
MRLQERFLIRKADRVIVVNHAIAAVMERMHRREIDAVVLNCAPYQQSLKSSSGRTIRATLGIPHEIPILLYSGGLMKQRGIEQAILSLKHIPRAILVILGQGDFKEHLRSLSAIEGLKERVVFKDYLPHDEVPHFISSADVGLIPYMNVGINHYLCSPSKLFHYIMAELPVACSDFPFLRKIVVENDLGAVFDPSSPASIASAVGTIVGDPDRYSQLRANVSAAKRRYCWEEEERRFLNVYRSLDHEALSR